MKRWQAWLDSHVDLHSGAIRESGINLALDFQYHYASYLLGKAALAPSEFPDDRALRVWHYFRRITFERQKASLEFNLYLLSLLHHTLTVAENRFSDDVKTWLLECPLPSAESLRRRNVNFSIMLLMALKYRRRLTVETSETKGLIQFCETQKTRCVLPDGFLLDTPVDEREGYPSLVYHGKMSAVLLLDGLVNSNEESWRIGRRAMDVLLELSDVRFCLAYGRSQMSLFGYANLFLALSVLCRFSDSPGYRSSLETLSRFLSSFQLESGEMALTPARCNKGRPGFDPYMHIVVYNAYAWAMVCLSRFLTRSDDLTTKSVSLKRIENPDRDHVGDARPTQNQPVVRFEPSGFVSARWDEWGAFLNVRHYPPFQKLGTDPRYMALTPQIVTRRDQIIIPPIPFQSFNIRFLVGSVWLKDRVFNWISMLKTLLCRRRFHNFLDRAGFVPFLGIGRNVKICPGTQEWIEIHDDRDQGDLRITSRFRWDAVAHAALVRQVRGRGAGRSYLDENRSMLEIRLQLTAHTMEFKYHVQITSDRPLRHARLVHLNLRFTPRDNFQVDKVRREIRFDSGWVVNHSEDLNGLQTLEIPGTTGPVNYLRCASPITNPVATTIRTSLRFLR